MDAFHRPLDQVQPVSEISNMKQMQWWRDGVVVNPWKSNLGLSATSSTAFASFIWKARDLEKHRLSRFKEMWVNVQKSCDIQKLWWSLHTRNGPKDGILPIFVFRLLGLTSIPGWRFNLLQIDVIRTLQTTLFMNTPGPLCRDLVFIFGANICFHSSFVFSFSRFSGVVLVAIEFTVVAMIFWQRRSEV